MVPVANEFLESGREVVAVEHMENELMFDTAIGVGNVNKYTAKVTVSCL